MTNTCKIFIILEKGKGGIMMKRIKSNLVFLSAVFLILLPALSLSEDIPTGNIVGFVYDQDGTTPLEGAVVKVKNISTDTIYESSKSDQNGVFTVKGVESGIYLYGVLTPEGEFNSENFFGVKVSEGETAKLSISLTPYEQKVANAIQEVYGGQSVSGESLVGTVVDYNFDSKTADVLVVKGLLQVKDRIHAKGKITDFYQNIEGLKFGNSPAKKLFAGQTANLKMRNSVKNGDLIYVVCKKRGILPLFMKPLGIASIIAGSAGIMLGIKDATNQPIKAASADRK